MCDIVRPLPPTAAALTSWTQEVLRLSQFYVQEFEFLVCVTVLTLLSLHSGTSIPGRKGRDRQAAQAGSHQRCLRRREISRARDLFYKADESHREDQQNTRRDASHSSGLVDSGSCEASHELFRARDVKSTVTLKKVDCWPVRWKCCEAGSSGGSPDSISRTCCETRVGHITALGDCL